MRNNNIIPRGISFRGKWGNSVVLNIPIGFNKVFWETGNINFILRNLKNRQVARDITNKKIQIGNYRYIDKNIVYKSRIGAKSSWSSDNRIKMQWICVIKKHSSFTMRFKV